MHQLNIEVMRFMCEMVMSPHTTEAIKNIHSANKQKHYQPHNTKIACRCTLLVPKQTLPTTTTTKKKNNAHYTEIITSNAIPDLTCVLN